MIGCPPWHIPCSGKVASWLTLVIIVMAPTARSPPYLERLEVKLMDRILSVDNMTIITSVSQLATLPLQGICQGGQPIMSYNFGAGNKERVKKAFFTQFTVCTVFTGCFWLIMLLFPRLFAGIFSNDTDLITYTAWALRIYMAGIFSLGFQVSCQQSFMALGQAKVSLLLACLRKLILLIPLIFILPLFIQNKVFAVFLAEPISDILAAIITTSTFFRRFDKILDRR